MIDYEGLVQPLILKEIEAKQNIANIHIMILKNDSYDLFGGC